MNQYLSKILPAICLILNSICADHGDPRDFEMAACYGVSRAMSLVNNTVIFFRVFDTHAAVRGKIDSIIADETEVNTDIM